MEAVEYRRPGLLAVGYRRPGLDAHLVRLEFDDLLVSGVLLGLSPHSRMFLELEAEEACQEVAQNGDLHHHREPVPSSPSPPVMLEVAC